MSNGSAAVRVAAGPKTHDLARQLSRSAEPATGCSIP
jgi:hypothetical protein